jgi:sulfur transfer protein SufE
MRIYVDTLQKRAARPAKNAKPRRNAQPVKARPVLACESQEWLYFKSQTAAKRHCFGKKALKLNTGITYALKHKIGSVLGWHFCHA